MFDQKCGISSEGEMRWTGEIGVGCGYKARTIALSLGAYVYHLVYQFGLKSATKVNTPLTPGAILQPLPVLDDDQSYRTPQLLLYQAKCVITLCSALDTVTNLAR